MTAMLRTVVTNGTGAAANIGKPAAGKTGTTDDNKDAYFVGYTPNIVTGVWVGSDDNSVMSRSIQGGTVPAIIWKDVMKVATEPYGKLDFNYPEVVLQPFKLNAANIKIIKDGEQIEEEEQTQEDEENTEKTLLNPKDVINNVKSSINQVVSPSAQSVPNQVAPIPQQRPAAQVQPKTPAPSPIPMAVPESLH